MGCHHLHRPLLIRYPVRAALNPPTLLWADSRLPLRETRHCFCVGVCRCLQCDRSDLIGTPPCSRPQFLLVCQPTLQIRLQRPGLPQLFLSLSSRGWVLMRRCYFTLYSHLLRC